jgi:hypothetical protein
MKYFLIFNLISFFSAFSFSQVVSSSPKGLAPLIIYKTKADYSNNIPVTLNETKDRIVSYPSIKDVIKVGKLARPDKLKNGYLLDNFGIGPNTVFTSYTFEDYSKLAEVPSIQEIMNRIIDYKPIIEMYTCGNRIDFKNIKQINRIIKNRLKDCTKIL